MPFCPEDPLMSELKYVQYYSTSCLPLNSSNIPTVGTSLADIELHVKGTLIPTLPATSDPRYGDALRALLTSIQSEYCFYYIRYKYALTNLLTLAVAVPPDTTGEYAVYKRNAIRLNNILSQILLTLQYVSSLSGSLIDIDVVHGNLQDHMRKLKNTEMEADAKSAMIDYTLEKNSSSRNLLAIYGFMNIVAVGMLVYLYRAA